LLAQVTERPALRKKIDALYAGAPDDFVAARNALAKELEGDEAKRVKALKKPTVAAALINRLARERPADMKAFAKAAATLRRASGKKLRAAAKAEREAAEALIAGADELLEEEGGGSAATRDKVIETIQAAAADPDLEELVVAGRLDKERSIASVGFGMDVGGGGEDAGDEEAGDEGENDGAEQRREREAELEALEKRVHEARQVLKKAQAAKKRTAKDLAAAEKQLAEAQKSDRAAAADLVEAEHELQDRESELNDL
jgi:hypothetical protein